MELFIISVCAISFGVIAYRFEQMRKDIKELNQKIKIIVSCINLNVDSMVLLEKRVERIQNVTEMEGDAIDELYEKVFPDEEENTMFTSCTIPKKPLTKAKK